MKRRWPKKQRETTPQPYGERAEGVRDAEKQKSIIGPVRARIKSATKKAAEVHDVAMSWAGQQISGGHEVLARAVSSSKAMAPATKRAFLDRVSAALESAAQAGKSAINGAAMVVNAALASEFSRSVESWLGEMFNTGIPSIYDQAVDAVYNATHIGGGHLHRLFDGSHSPWSMWEKVRGVSEQDTLAQEVVGYFSALGKDLSSKVGIPLLDWNKASYDQVAGALNTTFGVPKSWFADLIHINATELIGTSIGVIAVALNWNKAEVKEFSSLAASLGISSLSSANPALAVLTLATLARALVEAKRTGEYSRLVTGVTKGGLGTGVFLASASFVPGPGWVGILAGLCAGAVVHKTMERVEISEITNFLERSFRAVAPAPDLQPTA